MSWMCGSRASGSLLLGCRAAMPVGPRMLARRLFSGGGTARRGGQRGRDHPGHPITPPTLPARSKPESDIHAARDQAHAEPAPQFPPPRLLPGTRVPPLPRFRLRMTNFCTAPTAREMERGEHPGAGGQWHHCPLPKLHAWGPPLPLPPHHARDAMTGPQCPQKVGSVPGWVPLCPMPQPSTSVPIRAPRGLGACPAVGGGGLLAGGGPALAGGTAPLEEEVDEGLGAVQPWWGPPCPLYLRLLLLPLLLWGQRRGLEWRGWGIPPQMVFGGWEEAWAGKLRGWGGYWGALTGEERRAVGCSGI